MQQKQADALEHQREKHRAAQEHARAQADAAKKLRFAEEQATLREQQVADREAQRARQLSQKHTDTERSIAAIERAYAAQSAETARSLHLEVEKRRAAESQAKQNMEALRVAQETVRQQMVAIIEQEALSSRRFGRITQSLSIRSPASLNRSNGPDRRTRVRQKVQAHTSPAATPRPMARQENKSPSRLRRRSASPYRAGAPNGAPRWQYSLRHNMSNDRGLTALTIPDLPWR